MCSTNDDHSVPNCPSNSLRSRAAQGRTVSAVEIAICSGPRRTTEDKRSRSAPDRQLHCRVRPEPGSVKHSAVGGSGIGRGHHEKRTSYISGRNTRRRQASSPDFDFSRIQLTAFGATTLTWLRGAASLPPLLPQFRPAPDDYAGASFESEHHGKQVMWPPAALGPSYPRNPRVLSPP